MGRTISIDEDLYRRELQYNRALMADALYVYEVNLSKNVIESDTIIAKEGKIEQVLENVGLGLPCKYTEFVERWMVRRVITDKKEYHHKCSLDYLMESYNQGEYEVTVEYWMSGNDSEKIYVRNVCILTKDEVTGDVMALIKTKDCTKSYKRKIEERRHLEVIEGLSIDYQSIFLINVRKKRIKTYRVAPEYADDFDVDVDESRYDEILDNYIEKWVYEEDKEKIREIVIDGDLSELPEDIGYIDIPYRYISGDMLRTNQIRIVKVGTNEEEPHVVVGFKNIDRRVNREKENTRALQEAYDKAEHANKLKTAYLNSMSYDVRSPLNSIMGFASLAISHKGEEEKVQEYIRKIIASGNSLLSYINEVLDMNRLQNGTIVMDEKEHDIISIVEEIKNNIEPKMKANMINFTMNTDEINNRTVLCDRLRVRQVFQNLLSNALKYTEPGGRVEFELKQQNSSLSGYASYVARVKDTGIGINKDFLPYIFEPFEREEITDVKNKNGAGLGLAIAKGIVEKLGGSIDVTSKYGRGTEFTVEFMLKLQENEAKTNENELHLEKTGSNGEEFVKRILVVEDDELSSEIVAQVLKDAGFMVEEVRDGMQAVEIVSRMDSDYFSLILMDIRMPIMDGYEATRHIREMVDVHRANIPIIAMTANVFDEDRNKAKECGMNAYMTKPVDIMKLLATLDETMLESEY